MTLALGKSQKPYCVMRNGIPDSVGQNFSRMLLEQEHVVLIAALDKTTGKTRYLVFRAHNRGQDNMTGLELLAEMLPESNGRAMEVMRETRPHPDSKLDESEWAFGGPDVPDVFKQ